MRLKKDGTPWKNNELKGSKLLDIARPMMARPVGCSSRELFEVVTAAGFDETAPNCYEAMKYQAEHGRAWMRWRVASGRERVPYGVERVFFASPELADASAGTYLTKELAMAANAGARAAILEARKEKDRLRQRENRKAAKAARGPKLPRPRKSVPAPVRISAPTAPTEVDYSRAKITVIPVRPGRYELEPGTRVVGGFATAGVGRYLDGVAA